MPMFVARPAITAAASAACAGLSLALVMPTTSVTVGAPAAGRFERAVLAVPGDVSDLGRAAQQVARSGGTVLGRYPVAGALVVSVPTGWVTPAMITRLADRPLRVSGGASAEGDSTVRETTGGWSPTGGAQVTVAVVDTGVATTPDLAGRVEHLDITPGDSGDGFGHGTFMAGLIAGSGVSSQGRYAGLAPAGRVLDVRVATATGETSLSLVLAGLQAVADRRAVDPTLKVLNLSLSEEVDVPPMLDPVARALERLWHDGVTVVVAAGNDGPRSGSVSAPGTDPVVLTVGAVDEGGTAARRDDAVADFSARGRGGMNKPEIVAPGVALVSLRAPGSVIDTQNPGARIADAYFRGSGTSMAAAVTSGAAAALVSARPDLTPDQVKALLTSTAYGIGGARRAGGLDLAAALAAPAPEVLPAAGPVASPAWDAFAAAWASGDWTATARAWSQLTPAMQAWASHAFSISVLSQPGVDGTELAARAWSARAWSARAWSARAWSARAWSADQWLARAWSARAWSSHDWSARAWSARAWSARAWSDAEWADAVWSARAWSARAWSARAWSARAWSVSAWGG